jgi:transposase
MGNGPVVEGGSLYYSSCGPAMKPALSSPTRTADAQFALGDALSPFRDTVERLKEVPGLGSTATEVILAEIGLDMSLFPSAGHLLSWAGFVPRLDESAGKRRSTRIRKGAPWLKPVLVQAAWGAARKKNSYISKPNSSVSKRATAPRRQRSRLPRRS